MSEQHVHYITEPLKSFIFTLSADSGLRNIFSIYPRETKWLSVRDQINNVNLKKNILCIEIQPVGWFCFMVGLITYKFETGLFNFNKTNFLTVIFKGLKTSQKKDFLNKSGHKI